MVWTSVSKDMVASALVSPATRDGGGAGFEQVRPTLATKPKMLLLSIIVNEQYQTELIADNKLCAVLETELGKRLVDESGPAGVTPLMASVIACSNDGTNALLKNKADFTKTTESGGTALSWAAEFGNMDAVQSIIHQAAGRLDTSWAQEVKWNKVLENSVDLRAHRVQVQKYISKFAKNLLYLLKKATVVKKLVNTQEHSQKAGELQHTVTPLMRASQNGHARVVEVLLAGRADVNTVRSDVKRTALMLASRNGEVEVVKLLLGVKDQDTNTHVKDTEGHTALSSAAKFGHEAVVRELVQHDQELLKMFDNQGKSPLHVASVFGHTEVATVLIQFGGRASINKVDSSGMTPLMAVAEKRHGQLVLLLLEADADPNKANHKFKTALHLAVEQASRTVVQP